MTAQQDRLSVGTADAIRCALGLLLPAWFIPLSLIVGVSLAAHHGGKIPIDIGTFSGFAFAAGVEALRRVVLVTRPLGGVRATRSLRAIVRALVLTAAPVFMLLVAEGMNGCFTGTCADNVTLGIAQVASGVSLLAIPLGWPLLRHSDWLRPRP